MSCFISPMPAAGLIERPPESNVMPLPTKTIRRFAFFGTYEKCTIAGLCSLP